MLAKIFVGFALTFSTSLVLAQTKKHLSQTETSTSESKMSIGIEPGYLFLGGIGGNFGYHLTPKTSVGVFGSIGGRSYSEDQEMNTASYKSEFHSFGLESRYMLTGDLETNGAYVYPSLGFISVKVIDYGTAKYRADLETPFARMTAGYQWASRETGFRFLTGLGFVTAQQSEVIVKDGNGAEVSRVKSSSFSGLAMDLSLGYTF